jgi:nucleoside 2-deoxyribosyltransferase
MRVYIAAPWIRKAEAIEAGKKFETAGFTVTSRWFFHEGDPKDPTGYSSDINDIRVQAKEDILDVMLSDAVVVLNLEKSEGKAVETGIALAHGKRVISVGRRNNIFVTLGTEVNSVEEAIRVLSGVTV